MNFKFENRIIIIVMIILFVLQYSQSENMSTPQIDIEKKFSEIYQN